MSRMLITGCHVFDGVSDTLETADVLVVDGTIREVGPRLDRRFSGREEGEVVELRGRTVLPGLIDAHVHVYIADFDVAAVDRLPMSLLAHHARRRMEGMLRRGFTTVRDAGGADYGLAEALRRGWLVGPRLSYCGHALSQTGGPRDDRRPSEQHRGDGVCPAHIGRVVDGADQVRRAIRDEVRRGAGFVKLMGSSAAAHGEAGLDQFSDDEIAAAVEEAGRLGVYVSAHVHSDHSARRLSALGVHCLEHGTFVTPATAECLTDAGTHVVPTLALVDAIVRHGRELGFTGYDTAGLRSVDEAGRRSLVALHDAGVSVGFGSDSLGPTDHLQTREFNLRAELVPPSVVLRSATSVNAAILGLGTKLGRVCVDYIADLIVVDGDPLQRMSLLDDADGRHVSGVMRAGAWLKRVGF